jgi:hypothetical protein
MKKADIQNGVIANVIEVDPDNVPGWAEDWPTVTNEGPGWLYEGSAFKAPPPVPRYADIESARAATTMTRAAFAIGAAAKGWITEQEAEEWDAGAAVPQFATDVVDGAIAAGLIPATERLSLRMAIRKQENIGRTDRLIPMLMAAMGVSPEEMDVFFGVSLT